MIPTGLKYTKDHEWIKLEGNEAVVGITDHAQSALGDITFIELPQVGRKVKQSESVSTVESVKAASDIYSPASGKVTAVNNSLADTPEVVNKSPYENGWIYRLSMDDAKEIASLMDATAYQNYLKELA